MDTAIMPAGMMLSLGPGHHGLDVDIDPAVTAALAAAVAAATVAHSGAEDGSLISRLLQCQSPGGHDHTLDMDMAQQQLRDQEMSAQQVRDTLHNAAIMAAGHQQQQQHQGQQQQHHQEQHPQRQQAVQHVGAALALQQQHNHHRHQEQHSQQQQVVQHVGAALALHPHAPEAMASQHHDPQQQHLQHLQQQYEHAQQLHNYQVQHQQQQLQMQMLMSAEPVPSGNKRRGSDRRRLRFWEPFNEWWRGELTRLGRRPTAQEIQEWYTANADQLWGDARPSLQETRVHAKCLRSLPLVREYFRKYRSKQKGPTPGTAGADSGDALGSPADGEADGVEEATDMDDGDSRNCPAAPALALPHRPAAGVGAQWLAGSGGDDASAAGRRAQAAAAALPSVPPAGLAAAAAVPSASAATALGPPHATQGAGEGGALCAPGPVGAVVATSAPVLAADTGAAAAELSGAAHMIQGLPLAQGVMPALLSNAPMYWDAAAATSGVDAAAAVAAAAVAAANDDYARAVQAAVLQQAVLQQQVAFAATMVHQFSSGFAMGGVEGGEEPEEEDEDDEGEGHGVGGRGGAGGSGGVGPAHAAAEAVAAVGAAAHVSEAPPPGLGGPLAMLLPGAHACSDGYPGVAAAGTAAMPAGFMVGACGSGHHGDPHGGASGLNASAASEQLHRSLEALFTASDMHAPPNDSAAADAPPGCAESGGHPGVAALATVLAAPVAASCCLGSGAAAASGDTAAARHASGEAGSAAAGVLALGAAAHPLEGASEVVVLTEHELSALTAEQLRAQARLLQGELLGKRAKLAACEASNQRLEKRLRTREQRMAHLRATCRQQASAMAVWHAAFSGGMGLMAVDPATAEWQQAQQAAMLAQAQAAAAAHAQAAVAAHAQAAVAAHAGAEVPRV